MNMKSDHEKSSKVINLVMEQDGLTTKLRTEDRDYIIAQHRTRIEEINRELESLTGKSL